jgi:Zyg-11 family protein
LLLLRHLTSLTHLDLSNCGDLDNFEYTEHLVNLTSLVLYNVSAVDNMIPAICKLRTLRHLDISQSKEENGRYENGGQILATLVDSLPKLTSLDISGTNLAGRGVAETASGPVSSDIPGLSSRMNTPFQYLGLYETSHDACLRHDIPAKLVRIPERRKNPGDPQHFLRRHAVTLNFTLSSYRAFRSRNCCFSTAR